MKKRRSLLRIVVPALAGLVLCTSLHAQRALQKNPNTGALIEGFGTGANTIKISATGTLEWVSGATLTNASLFRASAGLTIGTHVQAWSARLDTLAALSNASGVLTNNGSGALSYTATSSGGNGSGDSGKVLVFGASGDLTATSAVQINSGSSNVSHSNSGMSFSNVGGGTAFLNVLIPATAPTVNATLRFPANVSGSLVSTGDTGTVTNAMLAGSIAVSKLAITGIPDGTKVLRDDGSWQPITGGGVTIGSTAISGGTSGRLLTSGATVGELTLGSGISTWLATPTLANLNSAVSDADVATTGANAFVGNQTINGNLGIGGVTPTTRLQIRAATNGNTDGLIFQPQNQSTTTYFGWAGLSTTSSFTMSSSTDLNLLSGDANYVRLGGVVYRLLIDGSHSSIVIPSFVLGVGFDYDIAPPDKIGVRGAIGVWNNYTSTTSNEGLHLGWASNVAHVWTVKGSGGGTARSLVLGTDATAQITLEPDGDVLIDYDQLPTSDPVVKGQLWRDGTTLKVSAGP